MIMSTFFHAISTHSVVYTLCVFSTLLVELTDFGAMALMNSTYMLSDLLAFIVCGGIDCLRYFLSFKKSERFKLKGALGAQHYRECLIQGHLALHHGNSRRSEHQAPSAHPHSLRIDALSRILKTCVVFANQQQAQVLGKGILPIKTLCQSRLMCHCAHKSKQ